MSRVLDLWAGMTGTVLDYAGATAPNGWLMCFGQSLVRAEHPNLFAAIGTAYGAADATHFNVPDCRGRVIAGVDNMGGADAGRLANTGTGNAGVNGDVLGAAGGADRHTLTQAQMASHNHPLTGQLYSFTAPAAGSGQFIVHGGVGSGPSTAYISGNSGDQAHPNVQPTIVLNKIIKT